MHPALAQLEHRPYALKRSPWLISMQWLDLLFAHWRVDKAALRALLPTGLALDTFDGSAWIGIVPFTMRGIRARGTPPMPLVSAFHELNVRTYVRSTRDDRPGVWFFSLDAASRLAVRAARASFSLPYFDARMTLSRRGERIDYTSERTHRGVPPASFDASYHPTGPVLPPSEPGTLEHFLTERYCLYAATRRGRVLRGEIHHAPWPLQPAECEFRVNAMTEQIGLGLPDEPPLLHFARRIEVVAWPARRV
ncbi:MAG: YqjF family protein [Phycisphaerales bacterium JB037]